VAKSRAVAVRTRFVTRHRTHHKAKMTIPIGIVLGLAPTVFAGIEGYRFWNDSNGQAPGIRSGMERAILGLTGYNAWAKKWYPSQAYTLPPLIAGLVAHYAANKFGLNRTLAKMNIPFIRI
jgi:hypothetical protein